MATLDAIASPDANSPTLHQRSAEQQESYDRWICRRKWSHWSSAVSDTAMMPRLWLGQAATFDPNLTPSHGDGVVVLNWDGNAYLREFSELDDEGNDLPEGHWRAQVLNGSDRTDWVTFDSRKDDAIVLGVLTAVHGRWSGV